MSCGLGKRSRTRKCMSMGNDLYGSGCEGSSIEHDTCDLPTCDCKYRKTNQHIAITNEFRIAFLGWSSWSEWTLCTEEDERSRVRKCLTTNPSSKECQGDEREVRQCDSPQFNSTLFTILSYMDYILINLSS